MHNSHCNKFIGTIEHGQELGGWQLTQEIKHNQSVSVKVVMLIQQLLLKHVFQNGAHIEGKMPIHSKALNIILGN